VNDDAAQVLTISGTATAFTAVCEVCLGIDRAVGLSASTFAGRLDADLAEGVFLCRRGHQVTVVRAAAPAATAADSAAA
jgi:hypothetical protein